MSCTIAYSNPRGDLSEVVSEVDALRLEYLRASFAGDPETRRQSMKKAEWAANFRERLVTGRRPEPRVTQA